MKRYDWELQQVNCTGCGICVDVCPDAAIRMTREMAYPEPLPGRCSGCLTCVHECPFAAIVVHNHSAPEEKPTLATISIRMRSSGSGWRGIDPAGDKR